MRLFAAPALFAAAALVLAASACSPLAGAAPTPSPAPRGFVISTRATPTPTVAPTVAATSTATPTVVPPTPTVTPGPIAYTLDFTNERRILTMHVGERLQLKLATVPIGEWISGVDDARVLAPVSPADTGIYQALTAGTTLVTAHVLIGCADTSPAVPCKPERGLWYQMRVYVV